MRQPAHRPFPYAAFRALAAVSLACLALSGLSVASPRPVRAALVATGVPDSATVKHDRTLEWEAAGVLANDLNILGGTTAVLDSGVSNGSLDLDPDGGFTYVPEPGFVGTDSFRYHPSGLLFTSAKVTITVTNDPPIARADSYTWSGGTLEVAAPGVLSNDSDADGDTLVAELDGGGISGSFDLDENGGFTFTPGGGFSGTGTVHYRVWDGVAWSATATITLNLLQPTPTPTPTPRATPKPTPAPTLPLPSVPLPLPSVPLPLPSVPLPLPSDGEPTSSPTPEPRDDEPRPTATPGVGTPDENDPGSPGFPETPGSDGSTGAPGTGSTPDGTGSGDGGPEAGAEAPGSRLVYDPGRLDLQTGSLGILSGFQVWAVPAATIGVPGLLVLLWVALQVGGGLAWIPAVRRLRGDEKRYVT